VYSYGSKFPGGETYSDPPISSQTNYAVNIPYNETYHVFNNGHTKGHNYQYGYIVHMTTTFLGMESITVPAGTFITCKLRQITDLVGTKSHQIEYEWIVSSGRFMGIQIKSMGHNQGVSFSSEVLTVQINGK
jgi:hypothetical protein